jgi:hypothetical protein
MGIEIQMEIVSNWEGSIIGIGLILLWFLSGLHFWVMNAFVSADHFLWCSAGIWAFWVNSERSEVSSLQILLVMWWIRKQLRLDEAHKLTFSGRSDRSLSIQILWIFPNNPHLDICYNNERKPSGSEWRFQISLSLTGWEKCVVRSSSFIQKARLKGHFVSFDKTWWAATVYEKKTHFWQRSSDRTVSEWSHAENRLNTNQNLSCHTI